MFLCGWKQKRHSKYDLVFFRQIKRYHLIFMAPVAARIDGFKKKLGGNRDIPRACLNQELYKGRNGVDN